jgi:hypothetical protein
MAFFRYINIVDGGEELKTVNLQSQSNNIRVVFNMPETYKAGSLKIYYNGLRDIGFTELTSSTFELDFSPEENLPLIVDYIPS